MIAGLIVGMLMADYVVILMQWKGLIATSVLLVAGLLGAYLAYKLYMVGLILFGAIIGFHLSQSLTPKFPGIHPLIVVFIMIIVCSILIWKLEKPVIILLTSFSGSWEVLTAVLSLWGGSPASRWYSALPSTQTAGLLVIVGWIALGTLGSMIQFRNMSIQE